MPRQIYKCTKHGEFEVSYNISETVRPIAGCPHGKCGRAGDWVPQVISFSVDGGTGAQRNPR
jgi:hypothetical protein